MSKVRLDQQNHYMWVDDRKYIYRGNYPSSDEDSFRWYKEDKNFVVSADSEDKKHKIPIEDTYDINPEEWVYLRVRIKDREKVGKLNRRFEKAFRKLKAEQKAERDAEKRRREKVEAKWRGNREESEASEREHERGELRSERAIRSSDSEETEEVARTKWGIRVTSNDEIHFFSIGVWKSTKYEGCTTVRITVAGKAYMYTLDKTQMAALRRELSRGVPT
jgi:hypothetical protein